MNIDKKQEIPENWIFTIQDISVNTPTNKLYIYENNTYIIQKAYWQEGESNILAKGSFDYKGDYDEFIENLKNIEIKDGDISIYRLEIKNDKTILIGSNEKVREFLDSIPYDRIFY